jgi:undecaprenyl diphosphate synthase
MLSEETLLKKIQQAPVPKHVAIIMDGNGRWAKKRGLPRILGHRAATESVRQTVRACGELGVQVLTLYTFSTENWSRPRAEINGLMRLLCTMLRKEVTELDNNGVRLQTIGRIHELPEKPQQELERAIEKLKHNHRLILNLALNYGGRQELVDAVRQILNAGIKTVDEKTLSDFLYTRGLPDPDLLIRTSGEQRISNFLIYQTAYTEFYGTPVLWPDFRKKDLYEAILDFQQRERRFGGTG